MFVVLLAFGVMLIVLWRRVRRLERAVAALREPAATPVVPEATRSAEEPRPVAVTPPPQPAAPLPSAAPPPAAAQSAPPPPPARPRRDWAATVRAMLDFEQLLGANWLSKIGVAVLVIGVAFFLAWQISELGPIGKIAVGTAVASALLGAGIWGERFERYRILARAALAGGWSLAFFVAYAAHHVGATRVIDSPLAGFVLMLAVVAAMVAHTLRFRSQAVTGLAFSIAFATVALNRVEVYSLIANVALAIGFAFVVVRLRWFALEILGIAATYFSHFLWLVPVIAPMHGHVRPFPQFYASAAILILYWAVFRASYVIRPPIDEKTSAIAGVLNSALLLAVLRYQAAHPELAFAGGLTLGAIELALALLPIVRRKRLTFLVLTTMGVIFVVAAIPFRYAPSLVSPVWLLEAAALVIAGLATSERAYQMLGKLTGLAAAVQIASVPLARLLGWRLGGGDAPHEWVLGSICLCAMAAFHAAAEVFELRPPSNVDRYLSYSAAAMGLAGGWALFGGTGAAVFWIVLAVLLAAAGRRFGKRDLRIEANIIVAVTVLRVLVVNLPSAATIAPHLSWRLATVSLVAAATYLLSRWNGAPNAATWTASALVALLAWYELLPISVAVAWTMAGVLLLELGLARASRHLRWQSYAFLGAAFLRVWVVNLNAYDSGVFGARVWTVVPIAVAFLYVHGRTYDSPESRALAWMPVTTLVALLRFEIDADLVAVAWAALALAAVAAAALTAHRVFLHAGLAVALATLTRGVLHNLCERSYFPPPAHASPWLLVIATAALLLASLPFAFRLRRTEPVADPKPLRRVLRWLDARPEQLLYFVPLLLVTALIGVEMRRGMLTVAWGVEAVVAFAFAVWVGERSYRLAAVALLLLCVAKIFVFDFWSLTLRDKALTGIVVGAALIGVSILYTRKREAILRLL